MLTPNATGLQDNIAFAQDTTREEMDEGIIGPTMLGPCVFPIKLIAKNVALAYRNRKIKLRGTRDMSGPHDAMDPNAERHGLNAGLDVQDEHKFPWQDWTSSARFAADCATSKQACNKGDYVVCKLD